MLSTSIETSRWLVEWREQIRGVVGKLRRTCPNLIRLVVHFTVDTKLLFLVVILSSI